MPAVGEVAERVASRMKFPQAFGIFLVLFLLDLIFPDFVPFIDEILLGLGTTLFALWREKATPGSAGGGKPPTKNVTPPAEPRTRPPDSP
jgi:hypothetical protein